MKMRYIFYVYASSMSLLVFWVIEENLAEISECCYAYISQVFHGKFSRYQS